MNDKRIARLKAISFERYNGGIAVKRRYGSSTVTKFFIVPIAADGTEWETLQVEGYGATPGERGTDAKARSGLRVGDVMTLKGAREWR